jgi:hypothetical protein
LFFARLGIAQVAVLSSNKVDSEMSQVAWHTRQEVAPYLSATNSGFDRFVFTWLKTKYVEAIRVPTRKLRFAFVAENRRIGDAGLMIGRRQGRILSPHLD